MERSQTPETWCNTISTIFLACMWFVSSTLCAFQKYCGRTFIGSNTWENKQAASNVLEVWSRDSGLTDIVWLLTVLMHISAQIWICEWESQYWLLYIVCQPFLREREQRSSKLKFQGVAMHVLLGWCWWTSLTCPPSKEPLLQILQTSAGFSSRPSPSVK